MDHPKTETVGSQCVGGQIFLFFEGRTASLRAESPEVLALLPDRFPSPTLKPKHSAQQIRHSPALGMQAPAGTAGQVQVGLERAAICKESEDGSFAVAAARTGAIVEDGVEVRR